MSWDNFNMEGGNSDFVKFETDKDVTVRIVSYPTFCWKSFENKKCTVYATKEGAAMDKSEDGAKQKAYLWVIERGLKGAPDEVKILDAGTMIFNQVKALSKTPAWAFDSIPDYDVVIRKTGSGKESTKYSVVPNPKTPLTKIEKECVRSKIAELGELKDIIRRDAVDKDLVNPLM